ncbi:failed axon connections homolog [Ptychodera flava]|uniref:failed axon connections homolog n=1 Tax=Ptychodera flava TaxID=63121 RepID=UPI00396A28D6
MSVLWTLGAVAAATVSVVGIRAVFARSKKITDYPQDTVILHQIGRGRYAPSLSPFPLKLETYLRFAKIPYKTVHSMKMSPKKKTPWITFNGVVISDSSFIIEFLNDKFNVDLNKHLSPSQRATARAFQKMVEEELYWALVYSRWIDKNSTMTKLFPKGFLYSHIVPLMATRGVKKALYSQGIGRHTEDELYSIAEKDIRALSVFLGDKQFLFGDEPCEEDCAIFGQLAQTLWQLEGSRQQALLKGDCSNLSEYCNRMKERFWPDWEQCIMGDQELKGFINWPETDTTVFKSSE